MCVHIEFSDLKVKVIGPKIGGGGTPSGSMVDGDGDGKCQEEGGKWVPCPPGVATGSKIVSNFKKASAAAKAVRDSKKSEAAKRLPKKNRDAAKKFSAEKFKTMTPDERMAHLSEIFNHEYETPDGRKVTVGVKELKDNAKVWRPDGSLSLVIEKKDEDGKVLGTNRFTINPNNTRSLQLNYWASDPKPDSDDLLSSNELLLKDMGYINLRKGLDVDSWPAEARDGWDWGDEDTKKEFLDIIQDTIENDDGQFETEEELNEVKRLLEQARSESLKDPNRVTAGDLSRWPQADAVFESHYERLREEAEQAEYFDRTGSYRPDDPQDQLDFDIELDGGNFYRPL